MIKMASNQKGSIMVFFAISLVCLLGFMGLVVDVGYMYLERTKLQNAVDAAAIAAAYELPGRKVEEVANKYLADNGFNIASAQEHQVIVEDYKRVTVTYKSKINTFFMRVLGINDVAVPATATAERKSLTNKYVLFSGSTKNNNFNIAAALVHTSGSVHSNSDINMHIGSWLRIDKPYVAEAVTGIDSFFFDRVNGDVKKGSVIDIPRFNASQEQNLLAIATRITETSGRDYLLPRDLVINGEMFFYAPGDLRTRILPGVWSGKGKVLIIADGDIEIERDFLKNIDFNDPDNMICFYSRKKGGTIKFAANIGIFRGIVYAPDGDVEFHMSGDTFYGGVIANSIDILGAGLNIYESSAPSWFPIGVTVSLIK